jgi:hypothetical protein
MLNTYSAMVIGFLMLQYVVRGQGYQVKSIVTRMMGINIIMYIGSIKSADMTKNYLFFPNRIAPKCIFDIVQTGMYFVWYLIIVAIDKGKK